MADQIFLEDDGNEMECLVGIPSGAGPHPGLVIAPHLPADMGLKADAFMDGVTDRYVAAGYACASPQVFHRQQGADRTRPEKKEHMNDDEVMVDLTTARDWLMARDDVDSNRIGILGHCTGGRMTILALTRDNIYKAGADFWGGGVNAPWGDGLPAPLAGVGNITVPVAGFFGNEDKNPPPEDVDELEAALKAAGKTYEFHRYDNAGHAFQNFANEKTYREEASEDAWTKALAFLDQHLKG